MNELLFVGMDISKEVKMVADATVLSCTNGMTTNELEAYKLGVLNTLSILDGLIESANNCLVVNINGINEQREFVVEDLENYLLDINNMKH